MYVRSSEPAAARRIDGVSLAIESGGLSGPFAHTATTVVGCARSNTTTRRSAVAGSAEDFPKFLAALLFSLIFVGLGAWIVLGSYDADLQKVACGWLGLVLGYWLS